MTINKKKEPRKDLCVLILEESLAKGNDIQIPSLGVTISAADYKSTTSDDPKKKYQN